MTGVIERGSRAGSWQEIRGSRLPSGSATRLQRLRRCESSSALGLVHIADQPAREFELAARFERDRAATFALEQGRSDCRHR